MGNWVHKTLTEEELKELVRDAYDMKLFTSLQCDKNMLSMVFMPAMFLGSRPTEPSLGIDNQANRKMKLEYIEEVLVYEKETPEREEFIKNIGMLYEYYSEASPRGVNGHPTFLSCKIVSYDDSQRFIEKYNKYVKKREEFEKNV